MYNNFDFKELERATQESLARIYGESLGRQEYVNEEMVNETYRKVRKILECPEMEKCHPYLYSLNMNEFNDTDTEKINKIYQLGLDRGVIQKDEQPEGNEDVQGCEGQDCDCRGDEQICGGPEDSLTNQEMTPQPIERKPIYTVMYSAQKDGHGAMGEYYSMAPTIEGAKEDCMNQMASNGYNDIMIMAVDQTYPGVEDDYQNDYTDHSLDDVSPNANYSAYGEDDEEEESIQEDDSEEFLKQETGDNSKTEEENTDEPQNKDYTEEENAEEDAQEGDSAEYGNSEESDTEDNASNGDKDNAEEGESDSSEDQKENTEQEDADTEEDSSPEEEDEEDGQEDADSEEKLTSEEKQAMQTLYTKTFKDVLKKMGVEKSVSEMTLQERTDFYEKLSEKWDKNDPSDFMNDKDQEKLNKIVVKPDAK